MTMGMNKPHRTFAERSYEPMDRWVVVVAWLSVLALVLMILGLTAVFGGR